MWKRLKIAVVLCSLLVFSKSAHTAPLVFEGTAGPGKGKHIVFLAGDHEYRSEETLPELARILAKHHGFKCTVLFNIDKETGEIVPGNSNMPGLEALDTADLAVVFLRFQNFPAEQMKHFDAYLERGGPVVGLRTATHAFKMNSADPYAKYAFDYKGKDYQAGFGHQVLGQTWVGHYGTNHKQSTRIALNDNKQQHPILRGVKDVWVQAGGYVGKPTDGEILTVAQPLQGMTPDSPADTTKPPMPSEWTRNYKSASGKSGRVFTSLYGASEDLLNDGYRRMLVNGCFWALGLEDSIKSDADISLVGLYKPNTFQGGAHARGIKPEMYEGFECPIPANNNTRDIKPTQQTNDKQNSPSKTESTPAKPQNQIKKPGDIKAAMPVKRTRLVYLPSNYRDPILLAIQQGDVVAILGNGLPDRMQHDGWFETVLQSALVDQQVRLRKISASGDRPDSLPRSSGAVTITEYLRHVKADVVFVLFGYNESYEGVDKPAQHQKKLVKFVKKTRGSKANGKSFPRIVLFSSIAHEDTRNPNVPDDLLGNLLCGENPLFRHSSTLTDSIKAFQPCQNCANDETSCASHQIQVA